MDEKKTVIIIDDNEEWLDILNEAITENFNYEVELYPSFEEAAIRLARKPAYHLVITDIYPEEGITSEKKGLNLARFVSNVKNVPVIVISGVQNDLAASVRRAFRDCNVVDFFEKQAFDDMVFVETVKSALETEDEKKKKEPESNEKGQPLSPKSYVWISLGAFIAAIGLLILLIQKGEELRNGIGFYFVLIPCGLSCAAFLFGAMRSFARYTGKVLGGILELGGPAVIFALVVFGGIYVYMNDVKPFSLTVYVHGAMGKTDVILENKGEVVLYLGADTQEKKIETSGKAFFPSIPGDFRLKKVPVRLRAEGYVLSSPNMEYTLKPPNIYVQIKEAGYQNGSGTRAANTE